MNKVFYDRICVMVPTYKRSETKLPNFIKSLVSTAEDLSNVCIAFVVNEKDRSSVEKINKVCEGVVDYEIILEDTKECDVSYYFNLAYEKTKFNDPGTCVSMFGDDMVFVTEGWDTMMLKKINEMFGFGIVYGDDDFCQHENLCVYFITSREFVELTGKPFMCEGVLFDFIDTIWMEFARKLNCAAYLKDLHIRHEHATAKGTPDEVWLRMREKNHNTMVSLDDYTEEMANNVRKNLAEKYLSDDISYYMTTYDRIPLLTRTVDSWNKSLLLPKMVFVFDDVSKDGDKVESVVKRMKNSHFIPGEKHLGCDNRNALSVTHFDTPAVMVIDSDTAFSPYWCIAANLAWEKIKDNSNIVGVTLFNNTQHKTIEGCELRGLDFKATVGGFGTIYKKEVIEETVKSRMAENPPERWSWDNYINAWVTENGEMFCCTEKSYLQHIGYAEGTHTTDLDMADYAPDFVGEVESTRKPRKTSVSPGSTILFAAMARLGDIIAASMVANMLISRGYNLTVLVINRYENLARRIYPNAKVVPVEPDYGGPQGDWSELTTGQMKQRFPNFSEYINAQIGCRENHYDYTNSGKHPCVWIRDLCNLALGIELGDDFKKHLQFDPSGISLSNRVRLPEKLAIISSEAKTSQTFTSDEMLRKVFNELKLKGYNPRFLVEKRPQKIPIRQINQEYLFGFTVEQCILLIRQADHFIGQDSGLSWCSLYSYCSKEIYHRKTRVETVNTYFRTIDENAKDTVLEDSE